MFFLWYLIYNDSQHNFLHHNMFHTSLNISNYTSYIRTEIMFYILMPVCCALYVIIEIPIYKSKKYSPILKQGIFLFSLHLEKKKLSVFPFIFTHGPKLFLLKAVGCSIVNVIIKEQFWWKGCQIGALVPVNQAFLVNFFEGSFFILFLHLITLSAFCSFFHDSSQSKKR